MITFPCSPTVRGLAESHAPSLGLGLALGLGLGLALGSQESHAPGLGLGLGLGLGVCLGGAVARALGDVRHLPRDPLDADVVRLGPREVGLDRLRPQPRLHLLDVTVGGRVPVPVPRARLSRSGGLLQAKPQ